MSEEIPMHLMTIGLSAACGVPSTVREGGRASSDPADVTCPDCIPAALRKLVWDMLDTMPASTQALGFALRAGRLGVTDAGGRPLVAACMHDGGDL